jgi:hypothetical protein
MAYQAMTPLKSSKYKKQDIPVLIRNARVAALTKDFSAAHQWLDICHELHPTDLEVMEARGRHTGGVPLPSACQAPRFCRGSEANE